jgi:hypothetical protein
LKVTQNKLPCDRIESDLITFGLFSDQESFTQKSIGLTDWRLNGFISELYSSKKLNGKKLEKTLLSSNGKMKCRKILLIGFGKFKEFDKKTKEDFLSESIKQAESLNCKRLSISLEDTGIDFELAKSIIEKSGSNLLEVTLIC